jgi:hypothetical protein
VTGRERQKRNIARALDGFSQLALVICAGPGDPARRDLATLGNEIAQGTDILVVNRRFLVGAEAANFATPKTPAGSAATGTISSKSHDHFSFFIVVG